jgi:hypothetical protein
VTVDTDEGNEGTGYKALGKKLTALWLVATDAATKNDIASQIGCVERTIYRWIDEALNWKPDFVRTLDPLIRDYLMEHNPVLKAELEKSYITDEVHRKELSLVLNRLVFLWQRSIDYCPEDSYEGLIINEHDLYFIDPMIVDCLFQHLQAEGGEFAKLKHWSDLFSLKLAENRAVALNKLVELKKTRMFRGICLRCESTELSGSTSSASR